MPPVNEWLLQTSARVICQRAPGNCSGYYVIGLKLARRVITVILLGIECSTPVSPSSSLFSYLSTSPISIPTLPFAFYLTLSRSHIWPSPPNCLTADLSTHPTYCSAILPSLLASFCSICRSLFRPSTPLFIYHRSSFNSRDPRSPTTQTPSLEQTSHRQPCRNALFSTVSGARGQLYTLFCQFSFLKTTFSRPGRTSFGVWSSPSRRSLTNIHRFSIFLVVRVRHSLNPRPYKILQLLVRIRPQASNARMIQNKTELTTDLAPKANKRRRTLWTLLKTHPYFLVLETGAERSREATLLLSVYRPYYIHKDKTELATLTSTNSSTVYRSYYRCSSYSIHPALGTIKTLIDFPTPESTTNTSTTTDELNEMGYGPILLKLILYATNIRYSIEKVMMSNNTGRRIIELFPLIKDMDKHIKTCSDLLSRYVDDQGNGPTGAIWTADDWSRFQEVVTQLRILVPRFSMLAETAMAVATTEEGNLIALLERALHLAREVNRSGLETQVHAASPQNEPSTVHTEEENGRRAMEL
ncbi:hypothetical protein K440DRAFT_663905 [Wilcoxina mikolae CBS 423.85]|nr:hypothetical protein K440DRAFT_663905 [Wilcoxina mikolae CBS 423.85]